ncbi:hypothetical protein PYW07_006711 [Mythimna separata]|uniref:Uncharacterized protein n=1 Tax=Mythimna separata TaxID=271217 RepID=A0AAD7YX80_MYTSE|nr:hypothetical protein PYW07_006711 [Mythimna separata]
MKAGPPVLHAANGLTIAVLMASRRKKPESQKGSSIFDHSLLFRTKAFMTHILTMGNTAQTHASNEETEQQLAETLNSDHAQEVFESDYAQELLASDHTQDPNEQPQENLTPGSPEADKWPPLPHLCEGCEVNTTDIPEFGFDDAASGPRIPIDENTTVRVIFDLLFTADIIDYIVTCTNAYGKSLTAEQIPYQVRQK